MNRIFLIVIIVLGLSLSAFPQSDSTLSWTVQVENDMKDYILKLMKKYKVTGLSVAMVDDQEIVWAQGFGYEDKEKLIKASEKTTYRVGSISKMFTAISTMQLVEKGLVNIDSAYTKYVPELSFKKHYSDSTQITPRMLMTHHSGLPGDHFEGLMSEKADRYSTILEELKEDYAAYPPNYIFAYSNIGASLVGYMVEKVSGTGFVNYVDSAVFRPMGMESSSFGTIRNVELYYSKGYKGGKEHKDPDIREVPAGLMVSNVVDLSKFMSMIFAGGKAGENTIIKEETLMQMLTAQNENIPMDDEFRIGLAFFLTNDQLEYAGKFAGHGGDTKVFHADLATLTDHKLGAVVLTNSHSGSRIAAHISSMILKKALKYKLQIEEPEDVKPSLDRKSEQDLSQYTGTYATPNGIMRIVANKNILTTTVNNVPMKIIPNDNGTFTPKIRVLKFIPITLWDQEMKFKTIDGQDVMFINSFAIGEKIIQPAIPAAWRKRVGSYTLLNKGNDTEYFEKSSLFIDGGFLKFRTQYFGGFQTQFLKPINDSEAIILGLGRGMHETIRIIKDPSGDEVLMYSGYELQRISR